MAWKFEYDRSSDGEPFRIDILRDNRKVVDVSIVTGQGLMARRYWFQHLGTLDQQLDWIRYAAHTKTMKNLRRLATRKEKPGRTVVIKGQTFQTWKPSFSW
jgi:hypothetical protein